MSSSVHGTCWMRARAKGECRCMMCRLMMYPMGRGEDEEWTLASLLLFAVYAWQPRPPGWMSSGVPGCLPRWWSCIGKPADGFETPSEVVV